MMRLDPRLPEPDPDPVFPPSEPEPEPEPNIDIPPEPEPPFQMSAPDVSGGGSAGNLDIIRRPKSDSEPLPEGSVPWPAAGAKVDEDTLAVWGQGFGPAQMGLRSASNYEKPLWGRPPRPAAEPQLGAELYGQFGRFFNGVCWPARCQG